MEYPNDFCLFLIKRKMHRYYFVQFFLMHILLNLLAYLNSGTVQLFLAAEEKLSEP